MNANRQRSNGGRQSWVRPVLGGAIVLAAAVLVIVIALATGPASTAGPGQATALATNPNLDPGTPLSGPAPGFTLTDQFGQPVSLRDLRGDVVILAFTDSQCTTICPLTTTTMVQARALLGSAGRHVALLGVDANPLATAVGWVRAYSADHGMLHQWRFLTGSLSALRRVWHSYGIEASVDAGQIDHTPALYVIDARGRLAKVYLTQMAYDSIGQEAQILADEVASLLPGHPRVRSSQSYDLIPSLGPGTAVTLPRAGGGTLRLGRSPQLVVFFATWLTETSDLAGRLEAIAGYRSIAARLGLPRLVAVDEASVEPSPRALSGFLAGLPRPLPYPVAIDESGRVADGYQVLDQPWFVLTSRSGQILWYWDTSTQGWLTPDELAQRVRAALSAPPKATAPGRGAAQAAARELAGSPAPLARLHAQAGQLLGDETALAARLRSLRGYPIVLNAWASWCGPCRQEFPVLAAAALRYGRRVAFVGVNTDDFSASDARAFLAAHPVSYPSYQSTIGALAPIAGAIGLPTTVFFDRSGHVTCRRFGYYPTLGALSGDIASCALG